MNVRRIMGMCAALLSISAAAQDTRVDSPINRVGLFKNGIALVERSVALTGDGTYYLAPGPEPLHGTLWVTSDAEVTVRRSTRTIALPRAEALDPLYGPLVGKRIGVRLRVRPEDLIVGTLVEMMSTQTEIHTDPYQRPWTAPFSYEHVLGKYVPRMLVIRSDERVIYIEPEDVLMVQEIDPSNDTSYTVNEEIPVLEVEAINTPSAGGVVTMLYLAKGLTWAPSYRLNMSESNDYSLAQHALIVNELDDIEAADTELITGFPAIMYGNVTSPLAPRASLQEFFKQVAAQAQARMDDPNNAAAITNQAVLYANAAARSRGGGGFGGGGAQSAIPASLMAGDGDLHYLPIGEQSLKKGDVLSVDLGEAEGTYREVLLWTESSERYGQNRRGNRRNDDDPRLQYPGLWDAVVLENPFDRPLTTAPCYIELDGRFLAQTVLYWTASGEEATLPVTKALGVPATVREEQVRIFNEETSTGYSLPLQEIRVTMTVNNPRTEPLEVSIQYRFQARHVHLPEAMEADARILSPSGYNDEYLVTAKMTVEPDATAEFQFTYDHHQ